MKVIDRYLYTQAQAAVGSWERVYALVEAAYASTEALYDKTSNQEAIKYVRNASWRLRNIMESLASTRKAQVADTEKRPPERPDVRVFLQAVQAVDKQLLEIKDNLTAYHKSLLDQKGVKVQTLKLLDGFAKDITKARQAIAAAYQAAQAA